MIKNRWMGRFAVSAAAVTAVVLLSFPAFAGEWKREEQNGSERWWYDLGGGSFARGWRWIDGDGDGVSENYFFDEEGWLVTGGTTPDGYTVNEKGAWTDGGNVRIRVDSAPGEASAEERKADHTKEQTAPPAEEQEEETASTEAHQETEAAPPETAVQPGPGSAGPGAASQNAETNDASSASAGEQIVSFARQYVGKLRYVYGGYSLKSGVDCSAFTKLIFQQFGKELPRGTGDQLSAGTRISAEEAVPGDLVFWARGGSIYHVGILSGNGKFIHASNTERGWVFEDNLYDMPAPAGYARY